MEDDQFTIKYRKDVLPTFYNRFFPTELLYRWLSYGNENPNYFKNREFSFFFPENIHLRYKSFANLEEMKVAIRKSLPFKIDIGAVYNRRPEQGKTSSDFYPVEKEVIFDMDICDYNNVRTCCTGNSICCKCWKILVVGCHVIDTALRDDFGYEHLLWVFSGRRGLHCWVCDTSARKLNNYARWSVAEYLQLLCGDKITLTSGKLHHSIKRAINIIEKEFDSVCFEDQDILGSVKAIDQFLSYVPHLMLRERIKSEISKHTNSSDMWNAIRLLVLNMDKKGELSNGQHLLHNIMLQYLYPRLDINVSKSMNHLLKAPFSIHPHTGKVSLPLNPYNLADFNPVTAPTISQLIDTSYGHAITIFNNSIVLFENFISELENLWVSPSNLYLSTNSILSDMSISNPNSTLNSDSCVSLPLLSSNSKASTSESYDSYEFAIKEVNQDIESWRNDFEIDNVMTSINLTPPQKVQQDVTVSSEFTITEGYQDIVNFRSDIETDVVLASIVLTPPQKIQPDVTVSSGVNEAIGSIAKYLGDPRLWPCEILKEYFSGVTNDNCVLIAAFCYQNGVPFKVLLQSLDKIVKKPVENCNIVKLRNFYEMWSNPYTGFNFRAQRWAYDLKQKCLLDLNKNKVKK